jgi:PhnB protein
MEETEMAIQPYLFFNGRCDEAIAHYQRALDAKVEMLMRYRESPEPAPPGMLPPGSQDKVMHASVRIGDAIVMMSDGRCTGEAKFDGFSLSIAVRDEATAKRCFAALAEGGEVRMPLGRTFWSPCFGMVADRFGVGWMVTVDG